LERAQIRYLNAMLDKISKLIRKDWITFKFSLPFFKLFGIYPTYLNE
jgi:hypothetical protein